MLVGLHPDVVGCLSSGLVGPGQSHPGPPAAVALLEARRGSAVGISSFPMQLQQYVKLARFGLIGVTFEPMMSF